MSQQAATIESLPVAFAMIKAMQAEGLEWSDGYRGPAREVVAALIEGRMGEAVDAHLDRLAENGGEPDRRNGYYRRHLLSELGDIELAVPRTRSFCPTSVLRAYARRAPEIDRAILAGFVLGLSTRKVGAVLLNLLGRQVSATTVSAVAKTLDAAVAVFHRRPLKDAYKVLMLDGVVLARKTGAGAIRKPVLVALGLRPDGKKEIIDFRLAKGGESEVEWERFVSDLQRRGLSGKRLEMICVDGGSGLLAALPTVFPTVPVQRCWAHKIRNVLDKVRVADQPAAKRALQAIMNADHEPAARHAARRLADRFEDVYPKAVACLRDDLDELLTCWRYKSLEERKKVRTTNAIERRFREVRRRTRPMGVFSDRTSMDRILFAVFNHENQTQGLSTPLLLTQTF